MEDEYICALSNSATFDDLESPQTPVSRSQYSLKANISQTVHPIHSMFGSGLGFSGSADRMALFAVRQNPRWRLTAILYIQKWPQLRNRFADRRDVYFRVRFSGSADLMVPYSMTFSDPEPQFQGHSILYSLKANISLTVPPIHSICLVLGKSCRGQRIA